MQPLLSVESGFPDVAACTHPPWQVAELILICCFSPVAEASWTWGRGSAPGICPVAPGEPNRGMQTAVSPSSTQIPSEGLSASQFPGSPRGKGLVDCFTSELTCGGKNLEFKPPPDSVLLMRTISNNSDKGSSKAVCGPGTPAFCLKMCPPGNNR